MRQGLVTLLGTQVGRQFRELREGNVFRPVNKGGRTTGERITEQAIYNMIVQYAQALGFAKLAPHDLRRTFAKLAHKGASGLDQSQLSLG